MTVTLFPHSQALLPWLAGESLFSLCSRHHRLWGHGLSARSTQIMFGQSRLGSQHDLPSGLEEFVSRTAEQFGTVEEIARDRTVLRFYCPFLDPEAVNDAVSAMRGRTVANLKFRMGLLTSRFRANHPLKACIHCMKADLLGEGWVYWHLVHQFPGIWMCPMHRTELKVSTVKSTGIERFFWSLPAEAQLTEGKIPNDIHCRTSHLRLTDLIVSLIELSRGDGWLSPEAIRGALRSGLQARGWLTPSGNVRLSAAAEDYLIHCSTLRGPEELNSLPTTLVESMTQLGRILRAARSGIHPLRLLLAIDWLYPNAAAFVGALESVESGRDIVSFDADTNQQLKGSHHVCREQVFERLKAGAVDDHLELTRRDRLNLTHPQGYPMAAGCSV